MLGINAIKITPSILMQISEIDEFKGLWAGLDKHTTGLHLLGDFADYGSKFSGLTTALKDQPLSADMIRRLHGVLNGKQSFSPYKIAATPLEIPSKDNAIGTINTAEPADIEPLLSKLCEWVNESLDKKMLHPLLIAAVFTSVFLQIAPFEDKNFRITYFLIILILLKSQYTYIPYVSLSKLIDARAAKFHQTLKHNQISLEEGKPDWSQWLTCFLEIMRDQKNELHSRLYDKEHEIGDLPALSARIMALFKEHKRLQMKQIIKLTNGRRATIKLRLSELLESGYLRRHGQGRGTWYSLV